MPRLLVVQLSLLSACSLATVTKAPPDHAKRAYFDCTSSQLAPGVDVTVAGLLALALIGQALSENDYDDKRGVTIAALLGLTGLEVFSAMQGFDQTSECAAAKSALALRAASATPPSALLPGEMPGCGADLDCKGDRICVDARCVDPPTSSAPEPEPQAPPPAVGEPATPSDAPPTDVSAQ